MHVCSAFEYSWAAPEPGIITVINSVRFLRLCVYIHAYGSQRLSGQTWTTKHADAAIAHCNLFRTISPHVKHPITDDVFQNKGRCITETKTSYFFTLPMLLFRRDIYMLSIATWYQVPEALPPILYLIYIYIYIYIYIHTHTHTHTGCPGRNVPDFGRMFLKLKYTDITQNTYIPSWKVTEIMAREVWKYDNCYTLTDY